MRITNKKGPTIPFSELEVGDTFLYLDVLYMKLGVGKVDEFNATLLASGNVVLFKPNDPVHKVNCEVVVSEIA